MQESSLTALFVERYQRLPKRLVVALPGGLRSTFCAIPFLRALRRTYPSAEMSFAGSEESRALVERLSHLVDRFVPFGHSSSLPRTSDAPASLASLTELARAELDVAIQLLGPEPWINHHLSLLGAKVSAGYQDPGAWAPDPRFFIPWPESTSMVRKHLHLLDSMGLARHGAHLELPLLQSDHEQVERVLGAPIDERFVVLHVDPSAERLWGAREIARVGDLLGSQGLSVVLTAFGSDRTLLDEARGAMQSPTQRAVCTSELGTLAALFEQSIAAVTPDCEAVQILDALAVPSVIVHTGSGNEAWAPLDRVRHRFLVTSDGISFRDVHESVMELLDMELQRAGADEHLDAPRETPPSGARIARLEAYDA